MAEKFIAGIQYITTIVAAGENGRLDALEKALPGFEQLGVDADIRSSTPLSVTLEVYVNLASRSRRFSPPPITKQTAEAYHSLIQTVRECGYDNIEEIRDGRTGLGEISDETPLFEVVDSNNH
ncbi:hypothetical protein HYX06_01225 [Candidatus Woesearchaeota archaeon]|nr:hypothetical protein [Candidatus Woesearchaeota archaeon]